MHKVVRILRKDGPLGAALRIAQVMQKQRRWLPGSGYLGKTVENRLRDFRWSLDQRFDQAYGTDTTGSIALKELTPTSPETEGCNWYEPVSPKIFRQLMHGLDIDFGNYQFVDMGSGKGRALLMAAEFGFKKIVGVEFAAELHLTSIQNLALFSRRTSATPPIELAHMDAAEYPIPDSPLVVFFYSPFQQQVMKKVLSNITASHARLPRQIILVFYGQNPDTIRPFMETGFSCREVPLRKDWSHFIHYRGLIFTSPETA